MENYLPPRTKSVAVRIQMVPSLFAFLMYKYFNAVGLFLCNAKRYVFTLSRMKAALRILFFNHSLPSVDLNLTKISQPSIHVCSAPLDFCGCTRRKHFSQVLLLRSRTSPVDLALPSFLQRSTVFFGLKTETEIE